MAALVGRGVGAVRVEVWAGGGTARQLAARWPAAQDEVTSQRGDVHRQEAFTIRHQGEELGALVLILAEPLGASARRLVQDLVGQAGVVLLNARLSSELAARLRDLR